jgi:hypothetical protein
MTIPSLYNVNEKKDIEEKKANNNSNSKEPTTISSTKLVFASVMDQ